MNYPHKVLIQRRGLVKDEGGGSKQGWNDVTVVWAKVKTLSGSRETQGAQTGEQLVQTVEMRYRDLNADKNRLMYRGRVLEIQSVNDVEERREKLVVRCIAK